MKILLTGAFGNVGQSTLNELINRGHEVRCFDVKTKANQNLARKYADKCDIFWGDLRSSEQVSAAVKGQDAVLHLAFVIPTLSATGVGSEDNPEWAEEINVGGTRNLINAVQQQPSPPKIIFTSSLHIYGRTNELPPPRKVSDLPQPIEHYAHHKVICEQMFRESGLTWTIYRLGAVLPVRLILDRGMFGVPLDNRIEFVHSKDVATALANGLEEDGVWGRVWHIGGGPECQLHQGEMVEQILEVVGLDTLPDEAFTTVPFPTDWLDTAESQKLLQFQRHSFKDYLEDLKSLLGFKRHLIRLVRPVVRWWMLRQSPVWARHKALVKGGEKVAVITGATGGIGKLTARRLSTEGYKTILVARTNSQLERTADQIRIDGGEALVLAADLQVEAEAVRLHDLIGREAGPVDLLVNIAGTGWYGYSEEMPWEDTQRMIDLNIKAMTNLSLLFLSDMKERGRGHIINVSSIAGGLPSQGVAVYAATKSFVDSFSTALYRELRGTGVFVSSIRPGAVNTPFLEPITAEIRRLGIPFNKLAIRPEKVAGAISRLAGRPKRVVYVPRTLRIVPWIELSLGWAMDLLGPLLLRRREAAKIGP